MALKPRLCSCRSSDPSPSPSHAAAVLLAHDLTGFCFAEAEQQNPNAGFWQNAEFIKMARNSVVPQPGKKKNKTNG